MSKEVEELLQQLVDLPIEQPNAEQEKELKRLHRFFEILFVNDPLSIVIRGHLYIDWTLIKLRRRST